MWVDADLRIRFRPDFGDLSRKLLGDATWMLQFEGQPLRFPGKTTYRPDADLLRLHAMVES
ncbi:MAG: hypothetical protein WD490_02300 [Opitutales bacterium]